MDHLIRRQSAHIQKKLTNNNKSDRIFYDKKWEWGFLRKQCQNLELEPFYKTYMQRLQRSYLSVFIFLQFIVLGAHSVVLLLVVENTNDILPEILVYVLAVIFEWASLFITFKEDCVKRRPYVTYIAAFASVFFMVVADIIIPLYHAKVDFTNPALRPAYAGLVLYAIYIFIPLSENLHALLLGLFVTICYIINFIMTTYRLDENYIIKTTTDGIFLFCLNGFGMYFRLMKEIAIRTAFLDRRECVEENLMLRYARDQEKNLLLSIIPSNLASDLEKDLRERIEIIKAENMLKNNNLDTNNLARKISEKRFRRPDTAKLFVNEHHDVSILYADVVNYTYLTTTLDVKNLVETLHELFVKFDQASEEYNCLRIKFLGDCYYCVSGIPIKNDHHAKSCVDLGLRMIRDIRDVKTKRGLNIDMRIGVHSGHCLSGVIGACKWQYDVWSKDVDIANRLESTGEKGRVHVSRQTLDLLDDNYSYESGTENAKKDEVLQKNNIETFLIKPQKKFYISDDYPRHSLGVKRKIETNTHRSPKIDTSPNFMQSSIEQYNQIWIQAKLEMSSELDKMPIGKFHSSNLWCCGSQKRLTRDEIEERKFRRNVSTFFLFFRDMQWELLFLKEPDVMLKYSCLASVLSFLGIFCLQAVSYATINLFWLLDGLMLIVLLLFLPLTWYKKLWIIFSNAPDDECEEPKKPKNIISKFCYDISDKLMRNVIGRIIIYLLIVGILCIISLIPLIKCDDYNDNAPNITEHRLCLNPWAITESLILTLCMTFLFPRIPFLFKFTVGLFIVITYCSIVMIKYIDVYTVSSSTNLGLPAEISHLLIVLISFIVFHLMDRQNEYIAKVDYNWKRQLQKKQEDAQVTNETINILVQNILPAHLAQIYLAREMKDELYSEEYENVAIMFATIRNKDIEKVGLSVLNEIICDFDEILTSHKGPLRIEKIKISGWTYMAACGLNPGRCESITSLCNRPVAGGRSSTLLPNGRRSLHLSGPKRLSYDTQQFPVTHTHRSESKSNKERKASSKNIQNPVYVMTEFAVKLMKKLRQFDATESFTNGKLRIGISHGEIMAGVVGSSKPLYDVWGNPVNMASRMDTTGIEGRIQVTEETAKVLQSFNIKCESRGLTYVKGRDNIPTYFVCQDDDLNLIQDNKIINDKYDYQTTMKRINSTLESIADTNSNDLPMINDDDTKF